MFLRSRLERVPVLRALGSMEGEAAEWVAALPDQQRKRTGEAVPFLSMGKAYCLG